MTLLLRHVVLGEFKYELLLKGIAPTTQKTLFFKCPLGSDNVQVYKFTHFLKGKPTQYAVKIEKLEGPMNFWTDAPNV